MKSYRDRVAIIATGHRISRRHGYFVWALIGAPALLGMGLPLVGCKDEASTESREETSTVVVAPLPSVAKVPEPPVELSLCAAIERNIPLQIANVATGDVMVLRTTGELDPKAVSAAATEAGATSVYRSVTVEAVLGTGTHAQRHVVTGLPATAMVALKPFVKAGRLPRKAKDTEILMGAADAQALGLGEGDTVDLWWLAARDGKLPKSSKRAKVVGLVESGPQLESMQTPVHVLLSEMPNLPKDADAANAVGVRLAADEDRIAWAKKLESKLGRDFRVVARDELQREALGWQAALGSVCKRGSKSATPPTESAVAAPSCEQLEAWPKAKEDLVARFGDLTLLVAPGELERVMDGVTDTEHPGTRAEAALLFDGALLTSKRARRVTLVGWPADRLEKLSPSIVAGDLKDVGEKGGVAIARQLALELGAEVGQNVELALASSKPSGPIESANAVPKLKTHSVKVVALFEDPLFEHSRVVASDQKFAASLDGSAGASGANVIAVWSDEPAVELELRTRSRIGDVSLEELKLMEPTMTVLKEICKP